MSFPKHKKLEYSIKAPGVKGVFFLRAHHLENEVDYHASLELNPLGIKIPFKPKQFDIPKLKYEARSTCQREFLHELYSGECRWSDCEPGWYRFYEKDFLQKKEFSYTVEDDQSISVELNGEEIRRIGIPSHRKVPFLDPLQFFGFSGGMADRLDLDGFLVTGKYREAGFEAVDDSEYTLSWMSKETMREIHVLVNQQDHVVQKMAYKLPLFGNISIDIQGDFDLPAREETYPGE